MCVMQETRVAYGDALEAAGAKYGDIVVIDADLSCCTQTGGFAERYPERYYNVGIEECNMIGIAAGMATTGKIAFANSFAMFTAGRAYDQIRNSVAYPNLNVKIIGTHAGLSNGEDGATHQCIEDLSIMRAVPNMVVLCPCDGHEASSMVDAVAAYYGPCYIRMGRGEVETVTDRPDYRFTLGKGMQLCDGGDVTIIATGHMVQIALHAAGQLKTQGISARVIDMHTIKPIDEEIIIKAAKETGAIVTTEEHNVLGGLGGAVSEVVAGSCFVPVIRHGVYDRFGRSGANKALMERYGLTPEGIIACVQKAIAMKRA